MTLAAEGLEREVTSARRNVFLLTIAQAILASAGPVVFSIGGLAGYQLLGEDKSLATLPLPDAIPVSTKPRPVRSEQEERRLREARALVEEALGEGEA